jgi:hypothetical protein
MANNDVLMARKIGRERLALYPLLAGKSAGRHGFKKSPYDAESIGFWPTAGIRSQPARGSRQAGELPLSSEKLVVMRKIAVVVAALMVASSFVVTASSAYAGAYTTSIQKCNAMANATQKKQCVATAQKNKATALKQCSTITDTAKKKACVARAS